MRFSEQCYYVFGDHTTFLTQNGTQGGATLFTLNEESEADFDSVSDFDRDSNLYAPMSFPQPPPGLHFANQQQQHHHQHHQHNMMQTHQPKIYSNMGLGIGGPVGLGPTGTGNYMSSSSSNATSNSTSTTSQNTTAQTIATASTSAIGI
jgi:hypothetical protein